MAIAVVGIAADLPSGYQRESNLGYEDFFKFLLEKGEAYERIPSSRFNIDALHGRALGQVIADHGAFLKDLCNFDYLEFGVSKKDAKLMSISTRKLIELAFLSLIDSGIDYRGRNVGCYMAGVDHDLWMLSGEDDNEARGSSAYAPSMIANRVSYHLDLRGPSIPIDTACSSSLTALHIAVQALNNNECEAAIVGGCQTNYRCDIECSIPPEQSQPLNENRLTDWLAYSQGGILSPDGKCKPFDAAADGFSRGEGAVTVVLKRLEDAVRDHDKVYASILGTGINSSGSLAPPGAPVAQAQKAAMERAFAQADRQPQDVDFVELHATGTAQGDPTEANWVGESFGRDDELLIGSVKGNIGHLEITAFLASLCKVCAMFDTGRIPPNINFTTPNPAIRWKEYRLRVPTEILSLPARSSSGLSLVAMSSSGIGGANGHCVVEAPLTVTQNVKPFWYPSMSNVPSLIIVGGLSPRATTFLADSVKYLLNTQDSRALSATYGRRYRSMTWRSFSVVSESKVSRFSEPRLIPRTTPPMVFLFSGQGPQHFDMGRGMFKSSAIFRESVLEMDAVYKAISGESLMVKTGLFDTPPPGVGLVEDIWPIAIILPAITMVQIALFDALASLGVKPDILLGHSAGETAILYASGCGSKAMAVELAIARGKAMSFLETAGGTMAALSCSSVQAQRIIDDVLSDLGDAPLDIGCYNGPNAVTVSGSSLHISLVVNKAEAAGIFARKLRTSVPVHSSMMDICMIQYKALVGDVFARYPVQPPKVETYSTESGQRLESSFSAEYFWSSSRGPVLFAGALRNLFRNHHAASFVEIGPHPVLSGYLSSSGEDITTVCLLRRPKPGEWASEEDSFLEALGKLAVAGHNCIDFRVLSGSSEVTLRSLPQYPFSPKTIPFYTPSYSIAKSLQSRNGPLNYPQLSLSKQTHPYLAQHIIMGQSIMPATGYIEMALEFGAKALWNIDFLSILPLPVDRQVPVYVNLEGSHWTVRSTSTLEASQVWPPQFDRLHAEGCLTLDYAAAAKPASIDLDEIRRRCKLVNTQDFYSSMQNFAQYGPDYQRVLTCHRGTNVKGYDEVLVEVRGFEADLQDVDKFHLHPAILDSALHVVVHPLFTGNTDKSLYYLPSKIKSLVIHDALNASPLSKRIYTHATFCRWLPKSLVYNITITNDDGVCLCAMDEFEVALHGQFSLERVNKRFDLIYEPTEISLRACLVDRDTADLDSDPGCSTMGTNEHINKDLAITCSYIRGGEMEIRSQIAQRDPNSALTVWVVSQAGSDADAAMGFTRSLRRENLTWTVRLLVFDPTWPTTAIHNAIRILSHSAQLHLEAVVDASGTVHIPRIVPSAAPSNVVPLTVDEPWSINGTIVTHTSFPAVDADHVIVRVSAFSRPSSTFGSFIGRLMDSSRLVMGIAIHPSSNFLVVHRGSIVDVPDIETEDFYAAPSALALAIGVISVGAGSFANPSRFRVPILVTHADTSVGKILVNLYSLRGFQLVTLSEYATARDIGLLAQDQFRLIVSGYQDPDDIRQLSRVLCKEGRMFSWSDEKSGIAPLLRIDPWMVGDAIRLALQHGGAKLTEIMTTPTDMLKIPLGTPVFSIAALFDRTKAYLLVGGIGSIGVRIAHWMYQNGARYILMTSRSGRDGIFRKGDVMAQRLLLYLETLSDLTLLTEAADATSHQDMVSLLRRVDRPLGGCMMLSFVLSDGTFSRHTAETYEGPFSSKVGVFKVLEAVISIETLDFFITFSSVSGLFGNPGQTNYASANTMLDGMIRDYDNAFSIIAPVITDTASVFEATLDPAQASRFRHLTKWGMSCQALCQCVADGIHKLADGPFGFYIPDFDWAIVQASLGSSPLYDQFVTPEHQIAITEREVISSKTPADVVCEVLDISPKDLTADVPFTAYGLDSLSAATLSYALRPFLSISQIQLLADSTLRNIEALIGDSAASVDAAGKNQQAVEVKAAEMDAMVKKYTATFPKHVPSSNTTYVGSQGVILITGTTGALGANILEHLLRRTSVSLVYALNRPRVDKMSWLERHMSDFKFRGLDVSLLQTERLTFLEGDLGEIQFGLSDKVYEYLQTSVTHILHIAWQVDFGVPLAGFERAIEGVRRLADFSLASSRELIPRLLFASTVGVWRNLPTSSLAEEVQLKDPRIAVGSGYVESKWVAERVLSIAAETTSFRPVIVRIGQLSGGLSGLWRTAEWVPSLIRSSVTLGSLPDGPDNVAWLPMYPAASAIVDMMDSQIEVLHLSHPRPTPWTAIMKTLAASLNVRLVPYSEWLSLLESHLPRSGKAEDSSSINLPALRLLEFFQTARVADRVSTDSNGLQPRVSTREAMRVSRTLRGNDLLPLGADDVKKWLEYWRSVSFLPI